MASSQVEGTVLGYRGRVTFNRALQLSVRSLALILPILATFLIPHLSCAEIVTATVTAGNGPYAVAVNSGNNKIYVANYIVPSFTVIDGLDNSTETVPLIAPVGEIWYPTAMAVNIVNNKVYVASQVSGGTGNGIVKIFDGDTNLLDTVTVGKMPTAVAVNPTINKIYVVNHGSNSVTVIDGADNSTTTVPVGFAPIAIAVNASTGKVYVANYSGVGNVTVIHADDVIRTPPVPVGTGPKAIAVNAETNKVYVVNNGSGNVTVIDGITDIPDPTPVPVGTLPNAVAVNSSTNRVYVANNNVNGTVSVINGATATTPATVLETVNAGNSPVALAVNSGRNKVYVANYYSNNVTVIDGITNTPTTLAAPSGQVWGAPKALVVNPETNKVYVANYDSDDVTVIPALYFVSISRTGTGTGTVTSSPPGIDCGDACSNVFPEGSEAVLLFQTPTTDSGFNGWGGEACSGIGVCGFSMLSDKVVSADFTLSPLVKNRRTGVSYNNLATAYSEAESGDTIMALSTLTAAGLNLNKPTNLIIEGGYDAVYSTCIGLTPVLGRVNVSLAPLHVHGVAIRTAP